MADTGFKVIRTATKKANRTEPADAVRKPVSRKPDSETAFRRVQVARAFEDIARQIREELLQGRLRPGDRLPAERELAVQFGVSRNTLREALRSLEIAGLITLRKGAAGGGRSHMRGLAFARSGDAFQLLHQARQRRLR